MNGKEVIFDEDSKYRVSIGAILWKTTFCIDDLPLLRNPINRSFALLPVSIAGLPESELHCILISTNAKMISKGASCVARMVDWSRIIKRAVVCVDWPFDRTHATQTGLSPVGPLSASVPVGRGLGSSLLERRWDGALVRGAESGDPKWAILVS